MDLYNIMLAQKLSGGDGGGDTPTGTKEITANGMYDVASFASASVSVPTGVFPSGTKSIAENGIYDVTDFASASVNVPIPSYSTSALNVTENGTYSVPSGVDGYNPVTVNVSGGGGSDVEDGIIQRTISGAYTNNRVTKIGSAGFQFCADLGEAYFQNVLEIEGNAFYACTSLSKISAPNVTTIGAGGFRSCYLLTEVSMPNVTSIGANAFNACSSLSEISLPKVTSLSSSAFYGCSSLIRVILMNSVIVSIGSTNVFSNTPITSSPTLGGYGSIYVPASLVDSYKNANVWRTISSRITSYVE